MTNETSTVEPEEFSEIDWTCRHWDNVADAWHRWRPVISAWLKPPTDLMKLNAPKHTRNVVFKHVRIHESTRLKILCLSRHLDLPIYRAVDAALDAAFKAEGVEPWEVVADPTLKELLSLDP